jgi:hypothetical protein
MLFRPAPAQNLVAIHAMLDSCNVEADHFRRVARAAMEGETPSALTTSAAQETRESLAALLGEIDEALQEVSPCTRSFGDLMHAQKTAVALLESVARSCDMLEGMAAVPLPNPKRISHEFQLAAE